jgi:hypothetical protein
MIALGHERFLFSRIIGAGFGLLAASTAFALGPRISEFLAENHGGLRDEDGETSDWIEIHHPGAAPLSLQGWSLTDDPRDFRKWRFPAVTLGPGGAANGSGLTPIAYWDFNGTARDQAGNGHDGDIRGAAYTTDAAAPPGTGQCLNFDGVDDRFYAAIDVSETAYSASLWFKADTAGRGVVAVVDQDFGGGGHDRHLYLAGSNIAARVWNNEVIASTGKNYADRRWHHLAHVVGASAGGQRIYVDGMLVASGAKAASDFDWQQGIDIGFSNPPPPRATC